MSNSGLHRNIAEPDRGRFSEIVERELLSLHEGNFGPLPRQAVRIRRLAGGVVTAAGAYGFRITPRRRSVSATPDPMRVSISATA